MKIHVMLCLVFVPFMFVLTTQAQTQNPVIEWKCMDCDTSFIAEMYAKKNRKVGQDYKTEINWLLQQIQEKSYLTANIDQIESSTDSIRIYLRRGPAFEWLYLSTENIPITYFQNLGLSPSSFDNKRFYIEELEQLKQSLLREAGKAAYPFARIRLKLVQLEEDGKISGKLILEQGERVQVEAIQIHGTANVSVNYLHRYLEIPEGSNYDLLKIERICQQINQLPFLSCEKDAVATFRGNAATIHVFLKNKRASTFDAILGLAPQSTSESTSLLFTGNLTFKAYNLLKNGEYFAIDFQQLRPATQQLNLGLSYPYLFQFPVGIDGELDIFKRDSSTLDLKVSSGFRYFINGNSSVKAFWKRNSSSLLRINEQQIIATRQLPSQLDFSIDQYGLQYQFNNLDYRPNPRKGWMVNLSGALGNKQVLKNNLIVDIDDGTTYDYNELYSNLSLNSLQYQWETQVSYHQPLWKKSTLKTSITAAQLINEGNIYQNEQFQIGGNRLLRGFDQAAILAETYWVGSLEYRFLIAQNSYLSSFVDYALVEKEGIQDTPLGFGGGLSFETKIGIFGFTLAYGQRAGIPLDLSAAKVHVGFVSLF